MYSFFSVTMPLYKNTFINYDQSQSSPSLWLALSASCYTIQKHNQNNKPSNNY